MFQLQSPGETNGFKGNIRNIVAILYVGGSLLFTELTCLVILKEQMKGDLTLQETRISGLSFNLFAASGSLMSHAQLSRFAYPLIIGWVIRQFSRLGTVRVGHTMKWSEICG